MIDRIKLHNFQQEALHLLEDVHICHSSGKSLGTYYYYGSKENLDNQVKFLEEYKRNRLPKPKNFRIEKHAYTSPGSKEVHGEEGGLEELPPLPSERLYCAKVAMYSAKPTYMLQEDFIPYSITEKVFEQIGGIILLYLKNPCDSIIRKVIESDLEGRSEGAFAYFKFSRVLAETYTNMALERNPHTIKFLKEASREQIRRAVKSSPSVLEIVGPQDEEINRIALEESPVNIQYIKDPSETLCLKAVEEMPLCIRNIENPTKKVIKEAVIRNSKLIKLFTDQLDHEDLLEILSKNISALEEIDSPDYSLLEKVVEIDPVGFMKYTPLNSEDLVCRALELDKSSLFHSKLVSDNIWKKVAELFKNSNRDLQGLLDYLKKDDYKLRGVRALIKALDFNPYSLPLSSDSFFTLFKERLITLEEVPPEAITDKFYYFEKSCDSTTEGLII